MAKKLEWRAWWQWRNGTDGAYAFADGQPKTLKAALAEIYKEMHGPHVSRALAEGASLMVMISPKGMGSGMPSAKDGMPGSSLDAWWRFANGSSDAAYSILEEEPQDLQSFLKLAYTTLADSQTQKWMHKDGVTLVLRISEV